MFKKVFEFFLTACILTIVCFPPMVMIYRGTVMLSVAVPEIYNKLLCPSDAPLFCI